MSIDNTSGKPHINIEGLKDGQFNVRFSCLKCGMVEPLILDAEKPPKNEKEWDKLREKTDILVELSKIKRPKRLKN